MPTPKGAPLVDGHDNYRLRASTMRGKRLSRSEFPVLAQVLLVALGHRTPFSSPKDPTMKLKHLLCATAFAAAAAAPAQATILFQDNFNADNTISVLNYNGLLNWTVSGGTIDYIRSGGFGITCVSGNGGCLDMDGSTGNAGRITSNVTFALSGSDTYYLEGLVSGNQRGGGNDSIIVGLIDDATSTVVTSTTFSGLMPNSPFVLRQVIATGYNGNFRIFFEGVGGDNIGAILDDVVLRDSAVPEPGTLALAGLALLAAARARRSGKR